MRIRNAPLQATHRKRRSHDFLTPVSTSECPNCHERQAAHRICASAAIQGPRSHRSQGSKLVRSCSTPPDADRHRCRRNGFRPSPESEVRGPSSPAATSTCASTWWPEEILRPALDRALRAPRWPAQQRPRSNIVHFLRVDQHGRQSAQASAPSVTLHACRSAHWCAKATPADSSPPATPARHGHRQDVSVCWLVSIVPPSRPSFPPLPEPIASARRRRQRRLRPRQPRPVRRHGPHYARNVLRIDRPRVGLLSIGEEDSKAMP